MSEVGRFNVELYSDCNYDNNGEKFHLLDLSEWDGNTLIKQNFLYISDKGYKGAVEGLKNESILAQLIVKPKNSRIEFDAITSITFRKI